MVEQEYWRFGWTKSHWWRWHSKWFWAKQWISMVWRWNYITGTSITQIYRQSGQHFISWLVDIPVLFVQTTELDTVVQHRHTTAWQTWVTNQMLHACHCNKSRSCVFFLCLFTLHSVPTVRIYSEKKDFSLQNPFTRSLFRIVVQFHFEKKKKHILQHRKSNSMNKVKLFTKRNIVFFFSIKSSNRKRVIDLYKKKNVFFQLGRFNKNFLGPLSSSLLSLFFFMYIHRLVRGIG